MIERNERALESWQGALKWRFGVGAARILPRAVAMPDTGCVGSGNSVDVPCLPDEKAMLWFGHVDRALRQLPDIYQVALALYHGDPGEVASNGGMLNSRRWRAVAPLTRAAAEQAEDWVSRVDRSPDGPTSLLSPEVQQSLRATIARGEDTTETVASVAQPAHARPLASPASPNKPEEVAEAFQRRDLRAGPPAYRWVQWVFDPKAKPKPHDSDRAAIAKVEREAKALIGAAQDAFALVYKPLRGES